MAEFSRATDDCTIPPLFPLKKIERELLGLFRKEEFIYVFLTPNLQRGLQ